MKMMRNIVFTTLSVASLAACNGTEEPLPTGSITPEPIVSVTPEPVVNVTPEPVVNVTPEPIVNVTPEPVVNVTPEPIVNVTPEPVVNVTPEPVVNVTPEPVVNVTPEPIVNVTPSPSTLDSLAFETFEIPLSGTANNGSTITNTIFPAARPDGGLTLGWNELDQGHLMRLDSNMNPEGIEWDLDGLMIVRVLGLPDDGLAVLVIDWTPTMTDGFNVDRHLRLFIYDSEGNKTRETSIVGGTGTGLKASWFAWRSSPSVDIVANGDRFSIFTKISRYWTEESGTHQGDLYIEVDADGNLDKSTEDVWSASHSNLPHLVLGPNGEGLRLTVGDANPFGLEYQTAEQYGDVVVWPDAEQQEIGKALSTSSVSAGDLCGFQYRDGRLFATVASGREQPFDPSNDFGDVLLLSWSLGIKEGDDISETWLTETPTTAEECPTLTSLGDDHQLIAWGTRDGTTATLALLDSQGQLVGEPTASTLPFHDKSLAIPMPDGSVAWTYAERNATKVNIVVVKEQ